MTVKYSGFSITWNETLIGDTVDAPCTGTGLNGKAQQKSIGKSIALQYYVLSLNFLCI